MKFPSLVALEVITFVKQQAINSTKDNITDIITFFLTLLDKCFPTLKVLYICLR